MLAATSTSLRERKKAKTRETIVSVALELFAENGYDHTTIAQIAEAAEVSPRTVSTYFPAKEEIVFYLSEMAKARFARFLEERPDGVDTMGALRSWLLEERRILEDNQQMHVCQQGVIDSEESLRAHERALMRDFELLLADGLAADLDQAPSDLEPRLAAAAAVAVFDLLGDERKDRGDGELVALEEQVEKLDQALTFITGGVAALRERQA